MSLAPVVLVTGFEPFGTHAENPSGALAKALDGRRVGDCAIVGAQLPVEHAAARAAVAALREATRPRAILHLGLAGGRSRIALERVAVNVLDYDLPAAGGWRAAGQPCVEGGPAAYLSTLPNRAILAALAADGIPAYVSSTAGTYVCNATLYSTLHAIQALEPRPRAGLIHVPLAPAMVAAAGTDEPSMDLALMLRAVESTLAVIARPGPEG